MQPHYPFIPIETDFDKNHLQQIDGEGGDPSEENMWNQKFNGTLNVSREELWEMYTANLEYVFEYVEELLAGVSGKTVVTADHGNYVGERASPIPIQEWGHPGGLYDESVVRVPWLEHESGSRRKISARPTDKPNESVDSELVEERLQNLGYKGVLYDDFRVLPV